jgi:hypothetical protein
MNSAESKIFPTAPVGSGREHARAETRQPNRFQHQTFQRQVAVYIPAVRTEHASTPFIVVQDGQTYISDEGTPRPDRAFMPPMLDNLSP